MKAPGKDLVYGYLDDSDWLNTIGEKAVKSLIGEVLSDDIDNVYTSDIYEPLFYPVDVNNTKQKRLYFAKIYRNEYIRINLETKEAAEYLVDTDGTAVTKKKMDGYSSYEERKFFDTTKHTIRTASGEWWIGTNAGSVKPKYSYTYEYMQVASDTYRLNDVITFATDHNLSNYCEPNLWAVVPSYTWGTPLDEFEMFDVFFGKSQASYSPYEKVSAPVTVRRDGCDYYFVGTNVATGEEQIERIAKFDMNEGGHVSYLYDYTKQTREFFRDGFHFQYGFFHAHLQPTQNKRRIRLYQLGQARSRFLITKPLNTCSALNNYTLTA